MQICKADQHCMINGVKYHWRIQILSGGEGVEMCCIREALIALYALLLSGTAIVNIPALWALQKMESSNICLKNTLYAVHSEAVSHFRKGWEAFVRNLTFKGVIRDKSPPKSICSHEQGGSFGVYWVLPWFGWGNWLLQGVFCFLHDPQFTTYCYGFTKL